MKTHNNKKRQQKVWIFSTVVVALFLFVVVLAVSALIKDDGSKRRRQIQMVTLVKPPPPPKIQEKPPEPKIEEEEMVEPEPEEAPPEELNDAPQDDTPAGDDLGLDAEGTAGSDGFGLVGKKGGRSLIGGSGDRTLMQRYAWYTRIIQEEIRKKINAHMTRNGGIPKGDHKALVHIFMDSKGRIVDFKLYRSSGNDHVDRALKETLATVRISEGPPEGMPRSIRLRVSSKG